MHGRASFVTLTYDDRHLPRDRSLSKAEWQRFAKRLRHHHGPFRFIACGEYGQDNYRPHYHAIIFGLDFRRNAVQINRGSRHPLWVSDDLAKAWGKGFHTVGRAEFDSASYVASYCTKKYTGDLEDLAYERVSEKTGEVWQVEPEFALMSRGNNKWEKNKSQGGLGKSWFDKYHADVYPDNFVLIKGQKCKPPAYYDKLLARRDPELAEQMLADRQDQVKQDQWNHSHERLAVREKVAEARIKARTSLTEHGL